MTFGILCRVFSRRNSEKQFVIHCLQSPVLCFLFPAESRCRQPESQTLISRLSDLIAVTESPHALAVQPEGWSFFLFLLLLFL